MNADSSSWQSLGQLLHEQARRFGNRTLFRFEGTDMTFAQAEEQTNRLPMSSWRTVLARALTWQSCCPMGSISRSPGWRLPRWAR